jgi:hypothetical protein
MAAYKDIKRAFLNDLVRNGVLKESYASVPIPIRERWQRKFLSPIAPRLQESPRLINRFMLGADPEFIFVGTYKGQYGEKDQDYRIDASSVGLKTGLAFGADQNGRLIELRPKPDRFALKVLASIWSELKWLALLHPETMKHSWQCGAFLLGDGIGGHIHFGRKRPNRSEEIRALDQVGRLLYSLGSFPTDQWDRRKEGDERGQRYGLYGDFRSQIHGYEYRTLPSWLDDPWLAYLCMVLTKLAIFNPKLVKDWGKSPEHVKHILAYYKGLDDDAAIAFKALENRGIPKHQGKDFKARWGIGFKEFPKGITVIPGSIEPTSSETSELFDFLVSNTPLEAKEVQPTWAPTFIPPGFECVLDRTDIIRVPGMGEILTGLCDLSDSPVEFYPDREERGIRFSQGLVNLLPSNWKEQIGEIAPTLLIHVTSSRGLNIGISENWRSVRRIQLTKKILTSGVFPIWKLKDLKEDVGKEWREKSQKYVAQKDEGLRSRVLVQPVQ